jgi:hypothetical protein
LAGKPVSLVPLGDKLFHRKELAAAYAARVTRMRRPLVKPPSERDAITALLAR